MKYILLVLISFLAMNDSIAQGQTYTTRLGKSIIIHDDYTYDTVIKEMEGAKTDLSPFEMPSDDNYVIDEGELKSISNLEKDANYREIKYYIKYLKAKQAYDLMDEGDEEKVSKKELKTLYNKLDKAKSISDQVSQLRMVEGENRQKSYSNIYENINLLEGRKPEVFTLNSSSKTTNLKSDLRSPYDIIGEDDCVLVFDGFDQKLDAKRKETQAMHLFGYTHPRLQRHFKEGDYVNTKASLAKIDGDYYLILLIDVASKSASSNYGSIPPKEKARIRFVDGSTVYCKPINLSAGSLQEYTGHTVYNPIFKIEKSDVNLMQKIEVDDIGIMWTSGFESYEIYDVDVLQKLATCLKK